LTIEAKVIEDSVSEEGVRLTTFQLKYPRFIHSEFMTHRMFSRNASSSRAIPVAKMIEAVENDPAMPIHWGKNVPGMQAKEEFVGRDTIDCERMWFNALDAALDAARKMNAYGLHKQVVNRILEPFQHISVVCTAVEAGYNNFFNLRYHPDAQPEIQALAMVMYEAKGLSEPNLLQIGEWHLPYITQEEREELGNGVLKKISAARCCRVSYNKHDGTKANLEEDLDLCEKLIGSVPLHASPFEHQAAPDKLDCLDSWYESYLHGNLIGWKQYRKMLDNEYVTEFKIG
jgi:thymidylate synthase ThyX